MILGIDASNIRADGGHTHLVELLAAADPPAHGFSRVIVWGGARTLDRIAARPWLVKRHQPALDGRLPERSFWQVFRLSTLARREGCSALYVPGGSFAGAFAPVITFSQNLLPFEWRELRRYGWSWLTIKTLLLRLSQSLTFRRAAGIVFLTDFARAAVLKVTGPIHARTAVIPHGIGARFVGAPHDPWTAADGTADRPIRLLYVSAVFPYKHQLRVAEAVAQLRAEGRPVVLDLVGPAYPQFAARLRRGLRTLDPDESFLRFHGEVAHEELPSRYGAADLFIFASSCETFGQILVEAMCAGLPIACSDRSSLPEVLGDAGVYFDPEDPANIARALRRLLDDAGLRETKFRAAFERGRTYSWRRCADETFDFIALVATGRGVVRPGGGGGPARQAAAARASRTPSGGVAPSGRVR